MRISGWLLGSLLFAPLWACSGGGGGAVQLVKSFTQPLPGRISGPAAGPERRLAVALLEAGATGGQLWILDSTTGQSVEGPFPGVALAAHAPVFVGSRIVLVGPIGKVSVLNLAGEVEREVPVPSGPATPSALTVVDGSHVAFGTSGGEVLRIDVIGGAVDATLDLGEPPSTRPVAAADGSLAAGSDTGLVRVWSSMGAVRFEQRGPGPIGALAFAADGALAIGGASALTVVGPDGSARWNSPRGGKVEGLRFNPAGNVIAWSADGIVEEFSPTGASVRRFRTRPAAEVNAPGVAAQPALLDDGGWLVADRSGRVQLVDPSGAAVASLELGGEPDAEATEVPPGTLALTIDRSVVGVRGLLAKP